MLDNETSVGRWLCAPEQTRAMRGVVAHVIARMRLPAPGHVRRWLLADDGLHEDIVADARVTYLRRHREGRVLAGKEKSFLNGITAFTTRTTARTEARRRARAAPEEVTELANQLRSAGPTPLDALATCKRALTLRRQLDRLPAKRRAVFVTAVFEGYAEAAAEHGITENNARVIVCLVMKAIKAALDEET